ncbi:unnamed protein product [Nesidiocoris tenuis]|uniref:Uncharacterized protein n=1 Tax=Nesidiocoris tenuis TaxID=355587 RepID=A0A6H5GS26_9HEMI|nr:unnamed protein product [Nesidiocoris tenuis]
MFRARGKIGELELKRNSTCSFTPNQLYLLWERTILFHWRSARKTVENAISVVYYLLLRGPQVDHVDQNFEKTVHYCCHVRHWCFSLTDIHTAAIPMVPYVTTLNFHDVSNVLMQERNWRYEISPLRRRKIRCDPANPYQQTDKGMNEYLLFLSIETGRAESRRRTEHHKAELCRMWNASPSCDEEEEWRLRRSCSFLRAESRRTFLPNFLNLFNKCRCRKTASESILKNVNYWPT